jgi:hypothetical protein
MAFYTKEAREEVPTNDGRQENNVKRFVAIADRIFASIPDRVETAVGDGSKLVRIHNIETRMSLEKASL